MSRPKHGWWSYMQTMIYKFPDRARALNDIQSVQITAKYNSEPKGGGVARTTENIALRQLRPEDQLEYDAVRRALDVVQMKMDGPQRLKIIQMVYWEKSHNLETAAEVVGCSYTTARRWHGEFIKSVAQNFEPFKVMLEDGL